MKLAAGEWRPFNVAGGGRMPSVGAVGGWRPSEQDIL